MAPAQAEPLPTDYSASADSSILSTDVTVEQLLVNLAGLPAAISADVGLASADADSTAPVKTSADGANIAAGAVGLDVAVVSGHAEQPAGPATDDWAAVAADLSPVANVGAISGTTVANWAGIAACVPAGEPLSGSTTTLASAELLPLTALPLIGDLTGVSLTAAETSSSTELVDNGGAGDVRNVVSTATASLADLSLLNGLIQVDVVGDATLTSTATGAEGTTDTTYTPPAITATAAGATPVNLVLGEPTVLEVPIVAGVADATVTLTLHDLSETTGGLSTSGAVDAVLGIDISVSALGAPALSASLDLFPLSTSATAPAGGVECVLPAPAITSPADGDWTSPTPTIEGTGVPGATVDVVIDGAPVGTATVAEDGTWSFPVEDALAAGEHDVVATQTLDGTTSAESNNPTFNVAAAPVITSPPDGSSTSDDTPPIEGIGQPGTEIEVFIDGESIGTTIVADDGSWTVTPTTPLPVGEHTATATQTGPEGLVQEATPVTFEVVEVVLLPPVITSPEDGSSTDDTTPTVEGDGVVGATVTVVIDGAIVGSTQVAADGTWTLEFTEALACGDHVITATQALDGLVSEASDPVDVTIVCAQGAPSAGADALPDTGAPGGLAAIALLGLALMGAGGMVLRRLTI